MKKILSPVARTAFKLQTSVGTADEVMLIESMKMEIPVPAEAAGSVKEILVAEGDAVKEGRALLVLV